MAKFELFCKRTSGSIGSNNFHIWELLIVCLIFILLTCGKPEKKLYSVGIVELIANPVAEEVLAGIQQSFKDAGYEDGKNISIEITNAHGDFPTVSTIVQKYKYGHKDMIMPTSTPCLQATLNSQFSGPIIFCSVANPVLAGAGNSETDHIPNVTGVPTASPFQQTIETIQKVFPNAKKIGTLYVPAEVNSEYYMNRAKEEAEKVGIEYVAVPIAASNEIMDAAKALVDKNVDVIYQISDNLCAAGFDTEVRVANENKIPLVANQIKQAKAGASLAVGWDFFDVGYKGAEIAIRVIKGEDPAEIPFQKMETVIMAVNTNAAKIQGVSIPQSVINKADKVFTE